MTVFLFGISFEISFLFTALIAVLLLIDQTGLMCVGLAAAVIHETGHFIAMAAVHSKPEKIRFCAYGVLINKNINMNSRAAQTAVYAGGCAANLIAAAVFAAVWKQGFDGGVYFCAANLITAVFSILPIRGLDGFDLLMQLLTVRLPLNRAEKIGNIIGAFFCAIPVFLFAALAMCGSLNLNLLITCVYLIIIFICGK